MKNEDHTKTGINTGGPQEYPFPVYLKAPAASSNFSIRYKPFQRKENVPFLNSNLALP